MVKPIAPLPPSLAVTVSDVKALRQLADSGQLKSWQAGAIMDVVVNRRDGALLMVETGKGLVGLPVPDPGQFKPGTALQLQVLALAPLQLQLRAAPVPVPTDPTARLGPDLTRPLLAITPSIPSGPSTPPSAPPLGNPSVDLIANLARQLSAWLTPTRTEQNTLTADLRPLPVRLTEWLARVAIVGSAEPHEGATTPPTSARISPADIPRLTHALLNQWPTAEQASDPEPLERLLRQALFAEPATAPVASSGDPLPNNRPAATSDWLTTLLRLLIANPASGQRGSGEVINAATVSTTNAIALMNIAKALTGQADSDNTVSPSALLANPLPDTLIDELASLLGRHQQHLLGNLQSDARQQPLYAELLLRQGERLDPFQLTVREDGQHNNAASETETPHHVVRLRFDLPGLGVCQFLLDLQADDLQLHFYSEQADTVDLFNAHVDALASTLAADSIHLNNVQSHRVEQLPLLQTPVEHGFHVKA